VSNDSQLILVLNDYLCLHQLNLVENNNLSVLRCNYSRNKNRVKKLKCWYSNVTSLNNKLDILSVELYSNCVDVAFITETWWTPSSIKTIKGYSTFYKNREISNGGGVCMFINNNSVKAFEVEDDVYKGNNSDHIWCSLLYGSENILCGCIYRPPLSNRVDGDTEILAALTSASKSKYDGLLICGDFNLPSLSWSNEGIPFANTLSPGNIVSKLYCDAILPLGIYQNVKNSTFHKNDTDTNTILDLVFSDCSQRIYNISHKEPLQYITQGHHVLCFDYFVSSSTTIPYFKSGQLNYRKGKYKDFGIFIDSFHDRWINLFHGNTVDECLNIFMNIYSQGVQKFIKPFKIVCPNNICLWQSIELKLLIQKKKHLWHDIIRNRFNVDIREDKLLYYKKLRRKVRNKIKTDIKSYESNIVRNSKAHPKLLYKYIKDKMNIKETIRAVNNLDGSIVTNPEKICEIFNNWFHSVFQSENISNLPVLSENHIISMCPQIRFDRFDISDRLKLLDGSKSIGPDNIHPYVLKQCAISFSYPLCLLFQLSIDAGVVPSTWKLANITPVHKSGSKLSTNNYRGISLTSVLCKLFERILGSHILNYLSVNKILSSNQHGFVPHLSTTTNLLESMDIITGALNKGCGVDVIYLDFIKAFDRVAHACLAIKLKEVGITGSLLSWCVSFLANRKQ